MALSPAQKEQFERDGFVVMDTGLPATVLDGIVAALDGQFSPTSDLKVPYKDDRRIQDAWRVCSHVRDAALCPAVLEALAELYGRKPLPFQTLNFRVGSEQKAHSDTIHFNSQPRGFMAGVWLALEDIDENNGPLVYFPGSQKLPEVTFKEVGVRAHHTNYVKYEDYIEDLIETKTEKMLGELKLQPSYGTIKKGQALIWSANLIHGGAPQKDKNRTRLSQVTHYYFEGCRYWSPMHSNENFTFWKYPVWITDGPIRERSVPKIINGIRWRVARALRIV